MTQPRPVNEALARPYSHPAPYDGWNARGNLANMKPTEALLMDNVVPGVQNVTLRNGCQDWKTGAAANVHSFLAWNGPTAAKLFAATNGGIYNVTLTGTWPTAETPTVTNGYWVGVMTATSGGNFLVAVNGVDAPIGYDGTTWTTPAITGPADITKLSYVALHKHRLWFIEKNSTNLWYLGTDAITGAASKFPVGPIFTKGGSIVALGTWTLDGGNGSDDYFVIVTSNGQIAVYAGTDPSASTTWALIGVYNTARPIGAKPLLKYGGDLLYLSAVGIIPLSTLVQSTVVDRTKTISFNIDGAFLDAIASYSANIGWDMVLHTSTNALWVNIPVQTDTSAVQFVMNTTTKAWCRFTNWNAACWAEFGGNIYFGTGAKVVKAWVGSTDFGQAIVGNVAQAYSRYGNTIQSKVNLVRPNFGFTGPTQVNMAFDSDFKAFNGQTIFTYVPVGTGAIWDTGLWNNGTWDSGASLWDPKWITVPGDLGYLHSFRLQIIASSGNFIWTSTDMALTSAGIL
jgi:hypothetical protein